MDAYLKGIRRAGREMPTMMPVLGARMMMPTMMPTMMIDVHAHEAGIPGGDTAIPRDGDGGGGGGGEGVEDDQIHAADTATPTTTSDTTTTTADIWELLAHPPRPQDLSWWTTDGAHRWLVPVLVRLSRRAAHWPSTPNAIRRRDSRWSWPWLGWWRSRTKTGTEAGTITHGEGAPVVAAWLVVVSLVLLLLLSPLIQLPVARQLTGAVVALAGIAVVVTVVVTATAAAIMARTPSAPTTLITTIMTTTTTPTYSALLAFLPAALLAAVYGQELRVLACYQVCLESVVRRLLRTLREMEWVARGIRGGNGSRSFTATSPVDSVVCDRSRLLVRRCLVELVSATSTTLTTTTLGEDDDDDNEHTDTVPGGSSVANDDRIHLDTLKQLLDQWQDQCLALWERVLVCGGGSGQGGVGFGDSDIDSDSREGLLATAIPLDQLHRVASLVWRWTAVLEHHEHHEFQQVVSFPRHPPPPLTTLCRRRGRIQQLHSQHEQPPPPTVSSFEASLAVVEQLLLTLRSRLYLYRREKQQQRDVGRRRVDHGDDDDHDDSDEIHDDDDDDDGTMSRPDLERWHHTLRQEFQLLADQWQMTDGLFLAMVDHHVNRRSTRGGTRGSADKTAAVIATLHATCPPTPPKLNGDGGDDGDHKRDGIDDHSVAPLVFEWEAIDDDYDDHKDSDDHDDPEDPSVSVRRRPRQRPSPGKTSLAVSREERIQRMRQQRLERAAHDRERKLPVLMMSELKNRLDLRSGGAGRGAASGGIGETMTAK